MDFLNAIELFAQNPTVQLLNLDFFNLTCQSNRIHIENVMLAKYDKCFRLWIEQENDILKSISSYMNRQTIATNNQDVLANSKNKFLR
jgi:hypothetical protein